MSRASLPGPATRKNILLLDESWARIAAYRHKRQIGTEMEALRRLIEAGLDAEDAGTGPCARMKEGKVHE